MKWTWFCCSRNHQTELAFFFFNWGLWRVRGAWTFKVSVERMFCLNRKMSSTKFHQSSANSCLDERKAFQSCSGTAQSSGSSITDAWTSFCTAGLVLFQGFLELKVMLLWWESETDVGELSQFASDVCHGWLLWSESLLLYRSIVKSWTALFLSWVKGNVNVTSLEEWTGVCNHRRPL